MKQIAGRVFKGILYLLGTLLLLAIVVRGAKLAYAAVDKEDRFYVLNAEPEEPEYLQKLDQASADDNEAASRFGHAAHRIKPGTGLTLGHRFYTNGSVFSIDDEGFRKITIWLPAGAAQSVTSLDVADRSKVLVLFSEGGSAWPDNTCSGRVSAGSLRIEKHGERYQVALHGDLTPQGNGAVRPARCASQKVDIEFVAAQLQFGQLTPWLGKAANGHPYAETYR